VLNLVRWAPPSVLTPFYPFIPLQGSGGNWVLVSFRTEKLSGTFGDSDKLFLRINLHPQDKFAPCHKCSKMELIMYRVLGMMLMDLKGGIVWGCRHKYSQW
jgi:hypothetical protein